MEGGVFPALFFPFSFKNRLSYFNSILSSIYAVTSLSCAAITSNEPPMIGFTLRTSACSTQFQSHRYILWRRGANTDQEMKVHHLHFKGTALTKIQHTASNSSCLVLVFQAICKMNMMPLDIQLLVIWIRARKLPKKVGNKLRCTKYLLCTGYNIYCSHWFHLL